jgi:type VI secretion system secreted protein VgrG
MEPYLQADRALRVTTPLGDDVLLLTGFTGREAISQLFEFDLDLLAEKDRDVAFDAILGQKIGFALQIGHGISRYFSGCVSRFQQGERDGRFVRYKARIVPQFWLLTKRIQCRIFQHVSVPEILKQVLSGLDTAFEIQGEFAPRDYCVQYQESDFHFASRLMEEEGIYYYFVHGEDGHRMVIANTPQSHPELPQGGKLIFEEVTGGAEREDDRIYVWRKVQELRSGKVTLWDHSFELPHKHLEADKSIQETVQVGRVAHKLKVGPNNNLEIYDWPGGYAQRYDGVSRSGGDQANELQKIFQENARTAAIRMQQEAAQGLVIEGESTCQSLVSGYKFTLDRHFNGNGSYVLASVSHKVSMADSYATGTEEWSYENRFTCIPIELPYRPPRVTPVPVVYGTQTAVVVGPPGEEIYPDKYGRVKVQFHWDRQGGYDADSSCWVRVGSPCAGKNWGMVSIPRVGHEVIVAFEEGDPNQPVIVGAVYNADHMAPYALPGSKTQSTWKSRSYPGGGGFNEIRYEDKKGYEQVFMHCEKNMDLRVKNNRVGWIGYDDHLIVKRDKAECIERDRHLKITRDYVQETGRDFNLKVKGAKAVKVDGGCYFKVDGNVAEEFGASHSEECTGSYYLKAASIVIEADAGITLKVGGNCINITPAGIEIVGTMVRINSGGAPLNGMKQRYVAPIAPIDCYVADDATPGGHCEYRGGGRPPYSGGGYGAAPPRYGGYRGPEPPTHNPYSEENKDKKAWVELQLVDKMNNPIPGEPYRVTLPDGSVQEGRLDDQGNARISNCDPGDCQITFPNLDKNAWDSE